MGHEGSRYFHNPVIMYSRFAPHHQNGDQRRAIGMPQTHRRLFDRFPTGRGAQLRTFFLTCHFMEHFGYEDPSKLPSPMDITYIYRRS